MITGNKKDIEQALETIRGMDSYMETTPTLQIIADIKAYANSDRKMFAAMAMQGVVSNHAMIDTINWEWLAKNSVEIADALITELNKTV